jgi:hypothetical protein
MRIDRAGGVLEYLPEILASTRVHGATKTSDGLHHRERFYSELFAVSQKHSEGVSNNWLSAYAGQCLAPPILKRWPKLEGCTKELHQILTTWSRYRYHHRCRPRGSLARTIKDSLYLLPSLVRSQFEWLTHKVGRRSAGKPNHVYWGPCATNFLGPKALMPPTCERPDGELILTARAACDTVVSVYAGAEQVAEIPLRAKEVADLRIACPPDRENEPLLFQFSSTVRCSVRGEYALEVYGSNLFHRAHVSGKQAA